MYVGVDENVSMDTIEFKVFHRDRVTAWAMTQETLVAAFEWEEVVARVLRQMIERMQKESRCRDALPSGVMASW